MKTSGVVKWFDKSRGFGFIQQDHGKDVFVHFTAVKVGHEEYGNHYLYEGDKVEFTVKTAPRGLQAESVVVVEAAPVETSRGPRTLANHYQ